MSMPNTTGLANRFTSLRVRPKVASSKSTWAFSALALRSAGGGVNVAPVKLAADTPSMVDSACVSGVTPSDAAVPPPTSATTDNSTLPAGKGMAVPLRSS